jgi:hypothetical protein
MGAGDELNFSVVIKQVIARLAIGNPCLECLDSGNKSCMLRYAFYVYRTRFFVQAGFGIDGFNESPVEPNNTEE